MPAFAYRGKTSASGAEEGRLEAASRDEAYRLLRERDIWVAELTQLRDEATAGSAGPRPSGSGRLPGTRFVPIMARTMFWRQFAQSQRAGVSLHDALHLLGDGGHGHLGRWSRATAPRVVNGGTLSQAMQARSDLFSPLEIAMVRAGEAIGRLDIQAERLGEHFERVMSVRNTLRWRVAYLCLVLLAAGVTGFVVAVVAPTIAMSVGGPKVNPALLAWNFFKPLLFGALVIGGVVAHCRMSASARRWLDRLKMSLPVVGPLFRKIAVARYARALGDLLGAGLPPGEAAEVSAPTAGNSYLERRLAGLPKHLRDGGKLSDGLIECCQMPPAVIQMVRTGEISGSLDELLGKVADYYEQEALAATQTLVTIGFALALMGMGLMVGKVVIGFWSGYYQQALDLTGG